MRDRALGSTVRLKFTTTDSNGAPVAPSSAFTTSDFRIYKDGSATEKSTTNGITVTSPFDSVTGRHLIEIDTSNSTGDAGFWASGSAYFVELNTAKTVNSQSVSGLEIGSFSLELQTAKVIGYASGQGPLQPTVAGRTLDVSAGGEAGIDWANVGSPTTTVALTGTTISTSQAVASVTGNVGGVAGTTTTFDALQTALNTAHGSGSWATATGFSTLDAAGVRTAVGLASANLDTQLDSLATPADVNAQVLDVLTTDTFAELSAVPAATSSLKDKLTWVFQWLRNKSTQTSTQRKLYADDGTTVVSTETVSDDGTTYTKGEAS